MQIRHVLYSWKYVYQAGQKFWYKTFHKSKPNFHLFSLQMEILIWPIIERKFNARFPNWWFTFEIFGRIYYLQIPSATDHGRLAKIHGYTYQDLGKILPKPSWSCTIMAKPLRVLPILPSFLQVSCPSRFFQVPPKPIKNFSKRLPQLKTGNYVSFWLVGPAFSFPSIFR